MQDRLRRTIGLLIVAMLAIPTGVGASMEWTDGLLDDCSATGLQASIGTSWEAVLDNDRGGRSSIEIESGEGTIRASGKLARGSLFGGPGTAGIMLPLATDGGEYDINQWDGIRVTVRRSGASMLLRIHGMEIENGDHFAVDIPASTEFATYEFPFSRMGQVMSPQMPWRGDRVTAVELICWSFPADSFSFELDSIEFYRSE